MKKIVVSTIVTLGLVIQVAALDLGTALNAAAAVQGATKAPTSQTNPILGSLSSLGVTPTQALGGSAALLGSAKNKMEMADFDKLLKDAPALDNVLDASYAVTPLANKTPVAEQFKVLGMDASMIAPFKNTILDYAKTKTSPALVDALAAAMQ